MNVVGIESERKQDRFNLHNFVMMFCCFAGEISTDERMGARDWEKESKCTYSEKFVAGWNAYSIPI